MSTERPQHSHDQHHDELLDGRVITEAMTNFPEGTPLREVLQWLHDRLSLQEAGHYIVQGFSLDSTRFQPTLTVDAMKLENFPNSFTMDARLPITPTDPEFIPANAWFTGRTTAAAWIAGEQPTGKYYHYDTFTNETAHRWGRADTVGYYTYVQNIPDSSSTQNFQWDMYKADVDPTPPSEDPEGEPSNDFRGIVYEDLPWPHGSSPQIFGEVHAQDEGLLNKRVLILAKFDNASSASANNSHVRIYFRGGNNYIKRGTVVGTSDTRLIVDGVEKADLGKTDGWYWYKIECLDNVVKFKFWPKDSAEPSTWNATETNASLTPGNTYVDFNMAYGGIIVPELNGSPWTHEFKHWSVEGINAGPVFTDAWLAGRFGAAAWFSSGNDTLVDAFISPTFRADSLIVEYVPGDFTIGAFREGRWEYDWGADAHIGGYAKLDAIISDDAAYGSYTADAWKVITTENSAVEDAVVKDIDRTYGIPTDGVIKDLALPGSFTADAYKNLLIEGSHTIDGYLGPGAHPPADAVVKRPDQTDDFTAGSWLWPQGVELYVANAVQKTLDNTDSVTADGADLHYEGDRYTHPHYDTFDRAPAVSGWGAPSHSGRYTFNGATTQYYVGTPSAGGANTGRLTDNYENVRVSARGPLTIDREVWMDSYLEPISSVSVRGNYYFGICGNLRLDKDHWSGEPWRLQVYDSGAWTTLHSWSLGGDPHWVTFRVRVTDESRIQAKVWVRANGEPVDWEYDGTPTWTPYLQDPYMDPQTTQFFTNGNPPYHQQFDNWFVYGMGYPHSHTQNAVIKDIDRIYTHNADAYFVPQPFAADAFIQPYFSANARIWLGTTFPSDAIKQITENFGALELIPSGPIGNTTYWQYNSSAYVVNAEQGRVSNGSVNNQGSIKSKETFGPQFGNAFPSVTNRSLKFTMSVVHRDNMRVGLYEGSIGTGHNVTGMYGFDIRDYDNRVEDLINGSLTGSTSSMTASLYSQTEVEIEYIDDGGGNSRMKIYIGGNLIRTSAAFATPTWTNFRIGFFTSYGIIGGQNYIHGTPQLGSWKDGYTNDAWIVSGDHIPFNAQITGQNINAIIQREATGTFTADATRHQLGEQLRDTDLDAWFAEYIQTLERTQFGWLELGMMQWGDVAPEVEQGHISAASWIVPRILVQALIDTGHIKAKADIIWDDRLFHFYDEAEPKADQEQEADNLRLWMWERFG